MDISRIVGKIWKSIEVSRKLIPFVPRSNALVRPPVCRDRWKFRSKLNKWLKTLRATFLIAFCATLAKTAFRSSWNKVAPILVTPYATIIDPATVHAVPPTARKSMFIESTILLK